MEIKTVRCLTNSIARFIHFISCQTFKSFSSLKDFERLAVLFKHFKPLLDAIVGDVVPADEILYNGCEELDAAVNEAMQFIERWPPKMSRISFLLQSEPLLVKIRTSSLGICYEICRLVRSSPASSILAAVQNCIQEFQYWQPERIVKLVEQALASQNDEAIPGSHQYQTEIIELLGLTSNQELLKESIAIERENFKFQVDNSKGGEERISQMVDVITLLRDHMLKRGYFDGESGVPVPSYFRCPLSLVVMSDPVIVASGQTFERASIQMWLDNELTICPKTRQHLPHTNLIPNYTIKYLISNWCQVKNLKFSGISSSVDVPPVQSMSDQVPNQDVIRTHSFCCSVHSSNSSSRSSLDASDVSGMQKIDEPSGLIEGNCTTDCGRDTEQSCAYRIAQSGSSAVCSSEYVYPAIKDILRITNGIEHISLTSGESNSEVLTPCSPGRESQCSKTSAEMAYNFSSSSYPGTLCFCSPDSASCERTTSDHAEKLIKDLCSHSNEVQTEAAAELRRLTKHNNDNRIIIGRCGAIHPLISLLHSEVKVTQEHAVTTLLNLSIHEDNKVMITEESSIDPLIHVLKMGNDAARENAAAALFNLSLLEEYRVKTGRSGAVKSLVELLGSGTVRGKKDAATALFNLSICHENKARIVQAGAVKYLVEMLDPSSGMVDKAVALLANLSTIAEGRAAIAREEGIPLIVEVVESGSQRGKENAASVLLQMCLNSNKFCCMVLQEGAVPPLVALSQCGSPRAREKMHALFEFNQQLELAE